MLAYERRRLEPLTVDRDPDLTGPPPPASGAWRPGDQTGSRKFLDVFVDAPLELEGGGRLGGDLGPISMAYETWGELDEDAGNAVLVLHALTGDSHAAGPVGPGHRTPGWWDGLIGPGRAIDTDRFFVIAPNVLGGCQGSLGPSSLHPDGAAWGSRFPWLTIRDQVSTEQALLSALGITRLHAILGGSMGGMRALEWALIAPERVERLVLLACGPAATAEQIALCYAQSLALTLDPAFRGGDYYDQADGEGPWKGMGAARRMGQITYRTRAELRERFGRTHQARENPLAGGRFAVESYLDHQAEKLAHRFDANTYLILCRAMDSHDVGRGRGSIREALGHIDTPTLVIGFDTDRLYPLDEQADIVEGIGANATLVRLESTLGHDAFLLEAEAIDPLVRSALR